MPINFYYKWTEKVELSVGYRYRDYQTQIGEDSTDHYLNVGARGKFSPKLTGEFTVGVTQRKLAKGGDDTMLGLEANLAYEISPKTSLELRASNAPDTSPQGLQQKNFSLGGLGDHEHFGAMERHLRAELPRDRLLDPHR